MRSGPRCWPNRPPRCGPSQCSQCRIAGGSSNVGQGFNLPYNQGRLKTCPTPPSPITSYTSVMKVAVVKETFPGERRVALVPADVAKLAKNGLGVILEPGAGAAAGFSDKAYDDRGGQLAVSRDGAFLADIVLHVRAAGFGHSS